MAKKKSKQPDSAPIIAVAIGASAGGLKALKEFFGFAKPVKNVAYLVTQHLDDNGKSLAIESLKRMTSMKVVALQSGKSLQGGLIYSVPPHTLVSFESGKVSLSPAKTTAKKLAVIDQLFKATGKEFGEAAVGVVLSGEASDGAQGLRYLNDAGGLTLAQNPETAEHRSMPESAIATGAVDHILRPKEMAKEISSYAGYLSPAKSDSNRVGFREEITAAITSICEILHQKTKHDFKHYKTSTLLRRIQRRMQVLQISTVQEYLDHLTGVSDECETLFKELLINVTSFFRDKDAFEALREDVLEKLVQQRKPNQKIRIWVAGCSTGEEAYSIAILLREVFEKIKSAPEVQIIATDIDDAALNVARRGIYPSTIAEHVSQERLSKYFVKRSGKFHVTKELREMCLFSIHNLITDPPFSQLDLITCRNVIIYLGPHLQKKLFPVFHYALRPNGYLFLGTSETLTSHKELFRSVNAKHRIAQRKPTAIKLPSLATSVQNYLSHFQDSEKVSDADLSLIGQRIALDEMPLRYAIANDEGQILSSSAGLNKYVQIPEGTFQNNIVKLVAPSLRAPLRTAFSTAKKEKRKITNDTCSLRIEDRIERTAVIVQPMPQLGDMSELYWVAFQNMGSITLKEARSVSRSSSDIDPDLVEQLEHELSTVRQELDKSVQDLEASNEELKSSNEELLSMNEELQSANEELETSKEEVQSSNEALQRANSDLENLLASTQIATLFLDDTFAIQNFTPELTSIYNISKVDIGRPITDLTSKAKEMPPLPAAENVTTNKFIEDEITLIDNRRILRRVSPYQTPEGVTSGIVVTFIDVTHLRVAEELRRESEDRFRIMADTAPVLVWISGRDRKRTWFNKGWIEFTGQTFEEALNEGWRSVVHPDDLSRYLEIYNSSFDKRSPFHIEYRLKHRSGSYRWISARGVPRTTPDSAFEGYIGACLDIDEQKKARELIKESETRFQTLVEVIPQLVWTCLPSGECNYLSKQWVEYTGIPEKEQLGLNWLQKVIHPDDRERTYQHWMGAVEGKHPYDIEYRIRRHDGEYRWFRTRGAPLRDEAGKTTLWFGTCTDFHDLKFAQERIVANQQTLELMIRTSPSFMCLLSGPNLVFEQVNEHYLKLVGHRDIIGKPLVEAIPEVVGQGFVELLERVRETGEPYVGRERPVNLQRTPGGPIERRYVDFVYQPSDIGIEGGIFVHGVDVTDKVETRAAIENERENFRNLFKQTPEMVCILNGPDHQFEFVNEAHVRVLGFDATGKTVREAQPESVEVHGILDEVYRTGKTAELHEIPVTVGDRQRYFNLTYSARRDIEGNINGVMILGTEVTTEVTTRIHLQDSETYFRQLVDTSPAILWITDQEAKCTYLSRQWYETTGGTPEKDLGYGWVEHVHPDDRDGAGKAFFTAVEAKGKIAIHYRLHQKSGDYRWAVDIGLPRFSPEGHFLGYVGTVIDVHDQIKSQEELLELQRRFEKSVSATNLGVWYCDLPFDELIWNPQTRIHFFMTSDEKVTIEKFYAHIHPDDRERTAKAIQTSIDKNLSYDIIYRTFNPQRPSEIKWIRAMGWTDYDKDGKPIRFDGITLDVTAEHQRQEELEIARQEADRAKSAAETANESKTRFLANMSHEIRTPLSAIVGFSDLLRSKMSGDTDANAYIERISRNSSQLSRLIDELLDLSKIEADKLEIEHAAIDIDAIIEDVKSAMMLRAEDKGIDLQFNWRTSKPERVVTDPVRLSQILINIVGNAVKFTEKGGVTVDLSSSDTKFVARVSDTGIGLTPQQRLRIFEPFMQADPSVTRKYGGTGLGLALAKRLAFLLGGDIWLERSSVGEGTVFVIEISVGRDIQADPVEVASAPCEDLGPDTLRGKTILVVDDSPDNRTIVNMFLKSIGANIVEASNGLEGYEIATRQNFDLVLMDIQMPIMDGYQAMQKLNASGYGKPVVALTAHAFKEEKDRCIAAGFTGYITKPINRTSLLKNVCELIAVTNAD